MSENVASPLRAPGHLRGPDDKVARPRGAATILLVRRDGGSLRVLMGRRNSGHDFMPNLWVFPGGRIDRADYRAPHATDLRHDVSARMAAFTPLHKARALAMAAVRETWEEAGLLLGKPVPKRPISGVWRSFFAEGVAPDLAALEVIGRAITPPMVRRRFDTWFLMADAERLVSLERKSDCGELEEIAWMELAEVEKLPLPPVTLHMLQETHRRVENPHHPPAFFRFESGKPVWGKL